MAREGANIFPLVCGARLNTWYYGPVGLIVNHRSELEKFLEPSYEYC